MVQEIPTYDAQKSACYLWILAGDCGIAAELERALAIPASGLPLTPLE